jgi:hypothetical protein
VEGSGHEAPCENSILSCGLPPYPALKQLSSYTFAGVTISMQETQLARHRLFLQQEDAKLGVVRLLLDAGADPMLVDSSGMDALAHALKSGCVETIALLTEAVAQFSASESLSESVDDSVEPAGEGTCRASVILPESCCGEPGILSG